MADNEGERIFAHCPNRGADHFTQHAARGESPG
jgi:hypothetical protein